jgi:hypothetical protein
MLDIEQRIAHIGLQAPHENGASPEYRGKPSTSRQPAGYMTINRKSRSRRETVVAFRYPLSGRKILESFAAADGHVTEAGGVVLTPILRDAVDFYTAERLRGGKDAVRLDSPSAKAVA